MRRIVVSLLLLTGIHTTWAQKEVPPFGKIDDSDLVTLKTCDFDPDAEACRLLDLGDASFLLNGSTAAIEGNFRVRVKVLKEKGIETANIKIPFYSKGGYETIENISGITYTLDANGQVVKTRLEKVNIYTQKISDAMSQIAFTLPNVKVGSVFEYKYKKIRKSYSNLDSWYFQGRVPTRFSQYSVAVPSALDFTYQGVRTLPMDETDDGYAIQPRRTFTMRNIPAMKDEPYMAAPKDYLQHIEFQLSAINAPGQATVSLRTTWDKLNSELLDDDDFGGQLHKNIPHTAALDSQLAMLKDSFARMQAVYYYVRSNMNWNGYGGYYANTGVRSAWDKKNGNTGDINLLLVNLLRDAGLRAYPILVSTRDHGKINTMYPFLDQFNTVEAYVLIGKKQYVLDGTDRYNPARLLPYDVRYTQGFVVDRNDYGWATLVDDQKFRVDVAINGAINSQGLLKAEAEIANSDYAKNMRCQRLKEGIDKYKETYFTKAYTALKVDSFSYKNEDNDSLPLEQIVQFTSPLSNSGDYLFLTPNLFLGLEKNPFLAETRFTDVDFGYAQSYNISGNFSVPDDYTVDALPKNVRMIMPDTSISMSRIMQAQDGNIAYRITLEFKRPIYFRDEYEYFREFYKKLYAFLNEQIVLKKKTKA